MEKRKKRARQKLQSPVKVGEVKPLLRLEYLSRVPWLINKLMEDGEKQGRELLKSLSQPADTIEEAVNKLRRGQR